MSSFYSDKTNLFEILKEVDEGKIQLPDFQRGWVWDDNRIKGVIASVVKSYPIGAVMFLETGNENIRFKNKPIEGTQGLNGVKPEKLVLDGQQRITSLYQAIISKEPVVTRNVKGYEVKRWYYIDMKEAMNPELDLEEAIFSIKEDKLVTENIGRDIKLDLSQKEYEFENMMFPLNMMEEYDDWRLDYDEYWSYDREKSIFWNTFERNILQRIKSYSVPIIVMKKENQKDAVCQVFEKVNTGGVSLTAFELLTASFAADDFDLKEDWKNVRKLFRDHKVLDRTSNTDLIQAITLYSTYKDRLEAIRQNTDNISAVSAKRKEMLNLELEDYKKYRDDVVNGFIKAAKILVENYIFSARELPYTSQLVPMAAILAHLGNNVDNIGNKKKLMRWFWNGVLGELYGSANETRYALDIVQVVDWILYNSTEPKTIADASFLPDRLHTLRTRNSAAYKGIYALLMNDKTKDWLSASPIDFMTYSSEAIDIHHIFPVNWCTKNNISREDYDSIINKTPLSGRTNRIVSGDAPSKYLDRLKGHAGVNDEEFNEILKSHVVNVDLMYQDNFHAFFNDRKEQILKRVEQAMGKDIIRDATHEEGEYVDNNNNDIGYDD